MSVGDSISVVWTVLENYGPSNLTHSWLTLGSRLLHRDIAKAAGGRIYFIFRSRPAQYQLSVSSLFAADAVY